MISPTDNHSTSKKVIEMPFDESLATDVTGGLAAADEQIFRLQVQLDMEGERLLLYKVVFVVLVIAALLIAREWAVWLVG